MRIGRLVFASLLLLSTVGCRYDGAFMQMDSNAPFPFFGFQLAVDSGVRPPRSVDGKDSRPLPDREELVPLREEAGKGFHLPLPRLQRDPQRKKDQELPSMLVRGSALSGNGVW
jgi:hypothetical protein